MIEEARTRIEELKTEAYTLFLAFKHPATPLLAKASLVLIVAYIASPIDLIPEFIPFLGHLDDALLIPLGLVIARRLIPEKILEECRHRAEEKKKAASIRHV